MRRIAATIAPGLVFDMDPLHRQAIVQGVLGALFFVILIFWPAGTFDYWLHGAPSRMASASFILELRRPILQAI